MKQLQKSDLKEGEIYVARRNTDSSKYIVKINNNMNGCFNIYGYINILYRHGNFSSVKLNYFEATPEEKHWLETCIKADQFVSYEEAVKTFIPEYVKCIKPEYWSETIKENNGNFIFKSNFKSNQAVQIIDVLPQSPSFKPSTKEAYDTQFVVKEPEFVLPKLWRIKLTNENQETVINYINKNTNDGERSGNIGMYYGYNGVHCTCIFNTLSNTEITFDQFKKYVLKENTTVTEEPKVVLEKPKDKVLQLNQLRGKGTTIVQVQCSEGGIYKIGDKITVFTKNSPNKGKPFTIKSFRWSNNKSKICAVTELHTPNGISLDKIELYVEPKVKVKDDFVLPEKWCVKVTPDNQKFINSVRDRSCSYTYITSNLILSDVKNSWRCNIEAKRKGFTEITFDQFKKYVLKDE